jgi:hypothetical protein
MLLSIPTTALAMPATVVSVSPRVTSGAGMTCDSTTLTGSTIESGSLCRVGDSWAFAIPAMARTQIMKHTNLHCVHNVDADEGRIKTSESAMEARDSGRGSFDPQG